MTLTYPYDPIPSCFAVYVDKQLQICNYHPPYLVTGISSGDSGSGDIAHLIVTNERLMGVPTDG